MPTPEPENREPSVRGDDDFRSKISRGPRLTTLMEHFEDIALGRKQVPIRIAEPDQAFLSTDGRYAEYYKSTYLKNLGTFNAHGISSVPHILEQCIRMAIALIDYARIKKGCTDKCPLLFYTASAADATHARSVAEYSKGAIRSLSDSPNTANEREFYRLLSHEYSFFHRGPFSDITPEFLDSYESGLFSCGFDVIWENTTFQMYGRDRCEQIAYVKRILKKDGIMILSEKTYDSNYERYQHNEHMKDTVFKSRHFTPNQIVDKYTSILLEMEQNQVTYEELLEAIHRNFEHVHLLWKIGNFSEIAASNDRSSLDSLIEVAGQPYVPIPFSDMFEPSGSTT